VHTRLQQLAQALLLLKGSALAGLLESALQRELLISLYELDDAAALLGPATLAPTLSQHRKQAACWTVCTTGMPGTKPLFRFAYKGGGAQSSSGVTQGWQAYMFAQPVLRGCSANQAIEALLFSAPSATEAARPEFDQ